MSKVEEVLEVELLEVELVDLEVEDVLLVDLEVELVLRVVLDVDVVPKNIGNNHNPDVKEPCVSKLLMTTNSATVINCTRGREKNFLILSHIKVLFKKIYLPEEP
jgi:hypothetical protein